MRHGYERAEQLSQRLSVVVMEILTNSVSKYPVVSSTPDSNLRNPLPGGRASSTMALEKSIKRNYAIVHEYRQTSKVWIRENSHFKLLR